MKASEKKWIAVLAIVSAVIIVGVLIAKNVGGKEVNTGENVDKPKEEFVEVLEDGTRLNTSSEMKKTKRVRGIEITDIQVTEKDNETLILGTSTNVTDTVQGEISVDIKVIDKEGKEITKLYAFIGKLNPGESEQFVASASFDYANAYDFEIKESE